MTDSTEATWRKLRQLCSMLDARGGGDPAPGLDEVLIAAGQALGTLANGEVESARGHVRLAAAVMDNAVVDPAPLRNWIGGDGDPESLLADVRRGLHEVTESIEHLLRIQTSCRDEPMDESA